MFQASSSFFLYYRCLPLKLILLNKTFDNQECKKIWLNIFHIVDAILSAFNVLQKYHFEKLLPRSI